MPIFQIKKEPDLLTIALYCFSGHVEQLFRKYFPKNEF